MKFFVCIALVAIVGSVCATQSGVSSSATVSGVNNNQDLAEPEVPAVQTAPLNNEFNRFRKSAGYGGGAAAGGYGAASIPAPPCPKNYLFSCQPNLAPVPCSAPAAGYGSAGAYTAPVPTYVAPVGNNYGYPQNYNGFVPSYNQFYQY